MADIFQKQCFKIFFIHTKAEGIHYQQNSNTGNVNRSPLGRNKMLPDGNLDIHKGIKDT